MDWIGFGDLAPHCMWLKPESWWWRWGVFHVLRTVSTVYVLLTHHPYSLRLYLCTCDGDPGKKRKKQKGCCQPKKKNKKKVTKIKKGNEKRSEADIWDWAYFTYEYVSI